MNPITKWLNRRSVNRFLNLTGPKGRFVDISGVNTNDQEDRMSSDSRLFHFDMKGPIYWALTRIPDVPQHWIDNLKGNNRILYEALKEGYCDREQQSRRKKIVWKLILLFLCIPEYDDNFAEIEDPILFAIAQNVHRFSFNHWWLNPDNWYQDGRGSHFVSVITPWPHIHRVHHTDGRHIWVDRELHQDLTFTYADPPACTFGLYHVIDQEAGVQDGELWKYPILLTTPDLIAASQFNEARKHAPAVSVTE